ncbi:hypothetical protein [Candidatus Poriferisocius sp.]|uniref:hypothetical protein n=1 Tax=Candidatus Poriferisocius sp. TaxID=3101276 RepID=UPI003B027FD6
MVVMVGVAGSVVVVMVGVAGGSVVVGVAVSVVVGAPRPQVVSRAIAASSPIAIRKDRMGLLDGYGVDG